MNRIALGVAMITAIALGGCEGSQFVTLAITPDGVSLSMANAQCEVRDVNSGGNTYIDCGPVPTIRR
jgi:hypothetical protein